MSRPLRIHYAGAWYHIHHHTLAQRELFPDDEYRRIFSALLSEISDVYGIEVHCYCLLEQEFHLLVRTPEPRLSEAMRHLLSQYTSRYNRLQNLEGPLFKGRYKSVIIENDVHVVQASRYIHRLPKELANEKGQTNYGLASWRWSSYPAYIGRKKPQAWLFKDQVLHFFAQQNGMAIYQIFVETGHDWEMDAFYHRKRIAPVMGSGDFKRKLCLKQYFDVTEVPEARLLLQRPSIADIVSQVAQFFSISEQEVLKSVRGRGKQNIPRSIAISLCRNVGGYSLKQIANTFGVGHYSSISVSVRRLNNIMLEDEQTRGEYEKLKNALVA